MKRSVLFFLVAIACALLNTQAMAFTFPDGLVSYWKFDESAGAIAADSVGGNIGQLGAAAGSVLPVWVPGLVGNALEFNGIDGFVKVQDHPSLDITSAITVEAWVKFDNNTGNIILVTKNWDRVSAPYHFTFEDNTWIGSGLYFGSWQNVTWYAVLISERPNTGQWYHLAGTFDGTALRYFINGVEVGSTPWVGSILSNDYPLSIGSQTDWGSPGRGGTPIDGVMDEVAIYNRALSSAELAKHYEDGLVWGKGYVKETIVRIDIKPGAYPNTYKYSGGTIQVVTFGGPALNVRNIDLNTLTLSGLSVDISKGRRQASFLDFDGDGFEDLQTKHSYSSGYFPRGDNESHLTGTLTDGSVIEGVDTIRIQ